jgi:transcriptional regulator of acetoin/glycerol metabolism
MSKDSSIIELEKSEFQNKLKSFNLGIHRENLIRNIKGPDNYENSAIIEAYNASNRAIKNLSNLNADYLTRINELALTIKEYHEEKDREKPLNILLDAEPGSGKSHFVRTLCKGLSALNENFVEFNCKPPATCIFPT